MKSDPLDNAVFIPAEEPRANDAPTGWIADHSFMRSAVIDGDRQTARLQGAQASCVGCPSWLCLCDPSNAPTPAGPTCLRSGSVYGIWPECPAPRELDNCSVLRALKSWSLGPHTDRFSCSYGVPIFTPISSPETEFDATIPLAASRSVVISSWHRLTAAFALAAAKSADAFMRASFASASALNRASRAAASSA